VILCLLAFAGVLAGCIWANWDVLNPYVTERTWSRGDE
jgi:hypothetical protein